LPAEGSRALHTADTQRLAGGLRQRQRCLRGRERDRLCGRSLLRRALCAGDDAIALRRQDLAERTDPERARGQRYHLPEITENRWKARNQIAWASAPQLCTRDFRDRDAAIPELCEALAVRPIL